MLVHPEVYAWLNRQSKSKLEPAEDKRKPLVTRSAKINKGGLEKAQETRQYADEENERDESIDYLNERKSNLNFYA